MHRIFLAVFSFLFMQSFVFDLNGCRQTILTENSQVLGGTLVLECSNSEARRELFLPEDCHQLCDSKLECFNPIVR